MGIDITAYQGLAKLNAALDEDGEPDGVDYAMKAYSNPDFPGRADGVEDGAFYTAEAKRRVLSLTYGSYNRWREQLAEMAGYPEGIATSHGRDFKTHCADCWDGKQGPFCELINFSDCEGVLGPVVCAKLEKDFAEFQAKADSFGWESKLFKDAYDEFRKGCEIAANSGAIRFH